MLNKYNLQIIKIASKDSNRFALEHLKVEKDKTIACDGRRLIEVTRPKVNKEDFPVIPGFPLVEDKVFYLNESEIKKVLTNLPKKPSLPILNNIGINQQEKSTNLLTTDLDSNAVIQCREKDLDYPDTEKVYPQGEHIKIKVNAKLLKEICEQVVNFTDDKNYAINLSIYDKDKPIKFSSRRGETGQIMQGLIMPIKK